MVLKVDFYQSSTIEVECTPFAPLHTTTGCRRASNILVHSER